MRFAVETWAPDYGAPVGDAVLEDSTATVDLSPEMDADAWVPITPLVPAATTVSFVDGVQRIDARVWVTDDEGVSHQGVCASWAAGVVRCNGRAEVISAEVRRGVLCYVPGARAAEGPERELLGLFGRAGTLIPLPDEPLIEPAMALMSCGPAFMALIAESFAEAGVRHGLAPDEALRMIVETMGGTAAYLAEHGYDTGAVKVRVATPGGTTERGLIRLEESGMREICRAAVDAVVEATRR